MGGAAWKELLRFAGQQLGVWVLARGSQSSCRPIKQRRMGKRPEVPMGTLLGHRCLQLRLIQAPTPLAPVAAVKPSPAVPVGTPLMAIGFGQYPLGVGQVKYLQQVRLQFTALASRCLWVLAVGWKARRPSTCSRCACSLAP